MADAIDADMARRLLIPFVEDSGGVYAPTLRSIAGKYVIASTVARIDMDKAIAAGCARSELDDAARSAGNFIIEADAIEGPWRGPFWISGAEGIRGPGRHCVLDADQTRHSSAVGGTDRNLDPTH